jgi:hypothetical protein
MLFLSWKASERRFLPSRREMSPATLLAVVFGLVSESYHAREPRVPGQ